MNAATVICSRPGEEAGEIVEGIMPEGMRDHVIVRAGAIEVVCFNAGTYTTAGTRRRYDYIVRINGRRYCQGSGERLQDRDQLPWFVELQYAAMDIACRRELRSLLFATETWSRDEVEA